jgi:hypothetical protein
MIEASDREDTAGYVRFAPSADVVSAHARRQVEYAPGAGQFEVSDLTG